MFELTDYFIRFEPHFDVFVKNDRFSIDFWKSIMNCRGLRGIIDICFYKIYQRNVFHSRTFFFWMKKLWYFSKIIKPCFKNFLKYFRAFFFRKNCRRQNGIWIANQRKNWKRKTRQFGIDSSGNEFFFMINLFFA